MIPRKTSSSPTAMVKAMPRSFTGNRQFSKGAKLASQEGLRGTRKRDLKATGISMTKAVPQHYGQYCHHDLDKKPIRSQTRNPLAADQVEIKRQPQCRYGQTIQPG